MGRVQDFDHDSVSCDNQCGKKVDAPSDAVPADGWRHSGFEGSRFDACGEKCADAVQRRLCADAGIPNATMAWYLADGTCVYITTKTH